ncbi:MAG: Hsp70 family protein [Micrococcales bacterium]|nr:Hsp70 family protein [Micrococcales bacterium]
MGWVLAVDFGSANTAAVWAREGRIERVRLEPGSDTMPSAVVLIDGQWRVGQAALNARRSHPQTFVAAPKARLGHEPVVLGDDLVSAPTMVSQVLAAVRERAVRAAGGTPPDQVVLTHPEHWGPQRQAALHEAARLAGFPDEQIIMLPEPVAAVRASIEPESLPPGSRVAVVDIGGGTCDVAVLEATDHGLIVIARKGDERLGGNDFDDLLYQWTLDQLRASGHADMVEILADPAYIGSALTLLDSVRGAKQDLSYHADAHIAVSVAADNETTVTITRDEYEQLIAEPLARAAALTKTAMETSQTETLTQLFLTGGSAFTPALARALHTVTGHLSAPLGDPKMVTATGALRTVLGSTSSAPAAQQPAAPVTQQPVVPSPATQAVLPQPQQSGSAPPPVPSRPSMQHTASGEGATTGAPVPGAGAVVPAFVGPASAMSAPGPYQPAPPAPGLVPPRTVYPSGPVGGARPAPGGPPGSHRWRNRILLMTVPSVVAFGLGVWVGVFQVPRSDDGSSITGVSPDAVPQTSPQSPVADQSAAPGPSASAPVSVTALSLDKAAAQGKGCYRERSYGAEFEWGEATASIAQRSFRTALVCLLGDKDQVASIDYVVPNGATTFKATVGQDDNSGGTGKLVRFEVLDVTTNQPLESVDVRFGQASDVSVSVEDLVRVRLEVTVIENSDVGQRGYPGDLNRLTTVAWADPTFS